MSAGLREAHRVLKADDLLIVVDIVASEQPLGNTMLQAGDFLRDASHVRDYRVSEWTAMPDAAGFTMRKPAQRRKLKMVFADWIARMRT